jgi:hypothetical protein
MATNKHENPNALADELANRLAELHRSLEDSGNKGTDWSLARALEDRIGAYQPTAGDFDAAEALLKKHGL